VTDASVPVGGCLQDAALENLVAKYGKDEWTTVAKHVGGGHTPLSCYRRYSIYLDKTLKVGGWTGEEDKKILAAQVRLGSRWTQIAQYLEGRSALDVEARWNAELKVRIDLTHERARCSVVKCTCWLTRHPNFCRCAS
jgi:hypothetical protein